MPRFFSRPRWFVDNTVLNWEGSRKQGRQLTYAALELGSNNVPVILVAALGFFTGSYILYVSGAVLPMLGYIYWHDATAPTHETAFNNVTVAGCIVGMILFGVLADLFGRRRMYGHELIILMGGTLGVVMSSTGFTPVEADPQSLGSVDFSSFGSMNIASWLFFWRFMSGIGIGGEYPLSAIIASEFASTHTRPRMLAAVFMMRSLGIAAGALVSLVVTKIVQARQADSLSTDASARAVDQIWRWVVGLALVPAFITALLRFTTPESPRYTLDILDDPAKAYRDTDRLRRTRGNSVQESHSVLAIDPSQSDNIKDDEMDFTVTSSRVRSRDHGHEDDELPQTTIKQYFWVEGNWRYLLATSLAWFLADFPRFADGLSNARTISTIWFASAIPNVTNGTKIWDSNQPNTGGDIFAILAGNSTRLLLLQSVPSIVGAMLLVVFITRVNRRLLIWVMFLVSGIIYLLTGGVFLKTATTSASSISILLYALIQFSNFFGIAPLTFMIPAELFPTKYRASCHGIAAALGKVGAVLASSTLKHVKFGQVTESSSPSKWLGYVLMIFAIPMFLGAAVCWLWIPDLQHPNGESKTLEQLAEGRSSWHGVGRRNSTDHGSGSELDTFTVPRQ